MEYTTLRNQGGRGWEAAPISAVSVEATMSLSLPPEILDLIVDHLHNEPTTLGACCLVSKLWIPRTRKHLFHRVEFCSSGSTLESWTRTFPDPSNSPAHYTRSLHLSHFEVIVAAISDALPWIHSFNLIVELGLASVGAHNHHTSFTRLHGLSPTLKYLHISYSLAPLPEYLNLICSFPLLEDLSLHYLVTEGNTEGWGAPPTSPKFTESLSLKGSSRGITRNLLDLPGGLHFSGITVWCSIRDGDLANELVSMCSDTLESLCIQYCQDALLTGSVADKYGLIAHRRFTHC